MESAHAAEMGTMAARIEWLPVLVGLLAMFVPTYYLLARSIWQSEDNAHGPIVLAVSGYFFWRSFAAMEAASREPRTWAGGLLLAFGLLCYLLGRTQELLMLEVGAQIPTIAGAILLARGPKALKAAWFPTLFLIFMIPLPGFLIDAVTGPLKQNVSALVEHLLYLTGYPIARSGVVLSIGQYQLLVADACSGLHSMFSLTALGVLYLFLVRRKSLSHNLIMLASIWPIAFLANVIRVSALCLITYYFGEEAGQGFLHEFAGMILFLVALTFLLIFDEILARIIRKPKPAEAA